MKSCDFSRSFITFVSHERYNNARIQVEARCEMTDGETGKIEDYYLVASCKGEDTYGTGVLFYHPSYDFCVIYSGIDFRMIRTHYNAERDTPTVGENRGHFLDVQFHVRTVDAETLADAGAIVEATLGSRLLNGRTEVTSPDGRYTALLEFPIKTMNVNDIRTIYQIDTGPMIVPNWEASGDRMVERFELAFVAYNREDEARFVIQEPTPVESEREDGPKVAAYSRITRMDARNSVVVIPD